MTIFFLSSKATRKLATAELLRMMIDLTAFGSQGGADVRPSDAGCLFRPVVIR